MRCKREGKEIAR
jgi:hypothetical protein